MDDKIKLVKHLAELGMLNFSEKELKGMVEDVKDIIKLIDGIKQADVSDLEPQKAEIAFDELRKDEVKASMEKHKLLKNAVKTEGGSFSVAKVVE